jgi:hypothetical protein
MAQDSIKCPKCGTIIPLSEALSHDIEERARQQFQLELEKNRKAFEAQLLQKDKDLQARLEKERQALSSKAEELQEQLKKDRKVLEIKIKQETSEAVSAELNDLKDQVESTKQKLKQAQDQEIALRKKQREMEEREKSFELEMARKMDEERRKIEDIAAQRIIEEHRLKDAEKDKKLVDALRQVEDLKRKMEQGSQQAQGEVLELELENMLRAEFPFDEIEAVSKGVRGGDILQTVKTQSGRICGKILWETKRTKAWSDSWIQKLKDDQRDAKAGLAVLVSEALPQGFHHFRQMDGGVWVTDFPSVISLAIALRVVLIQVANAREVEMGKQEKMELVYNYLTGPEFKNRVSAIIEAFRSMHEDLEAEKRAMQRIWEKRAKQIEKVISNTSGMYGDLEGLAGNALPAIKILELPVGADEDEVSKTEEHLT